MGGETQRGWIGSMVKVKERAVSGIGIPTWRLRKTYTLPMPLLRRRLLLTKGFWHAQSPSFAKTSTIILWFLHFSTHLAVRGWPFA